MTLLLRMEGLRFVRNPINLWVIAAFALVLIMAAVEGGLSARAWREQAAQAEAQWHKSLAAQQAQAAQASIGGLNAPDLSALAANNAIAPSVRGIVEAVTEEALAALPDAEREALHRALLTIIDTLNRPEPAEAARNTDETRP